MVGYLEYGQALRNLDQLLNLLSPKELEAVDRLVASRDEFTVFTNLSRRFSQMAAAQEQPSASDYNGQRGLAWVMALARIELGAMLAGFTNVPEPLMNVGPSQFERDAYWQLLQDGATTHYWALASDPALPEVTKMSPARTEVLSYSRRLVIARSMLRAAVQLGIDRYNPLQLRQWVTWKENLDLMQVGFVTKIRLYLEEQYSSRTAQSTSHSRSTYTDACEALLRAEQQQLQERTGDTVPNSK